MKDLFLNKKFVIIFFSAIFAVILILSLITAKCDGQEKLIKIEKGWGSDEIGQKLKDEGLIGSKWVFVFYAWIKGYNVHLQAGEYLLDSKMSVLKIARMITNGEISENYVKVTIPEGWTNKKIEERLIASGVLKEEDKLPKEKEGYLFPDTYYFERKSSVDIVVKKMSDNFMKKIGEDISKDLLIDSSMKLPNAVIMASIIEREVVSDEDRVIVSGIFWKRIENNIPLQSCATIAYILGVEKKQYSYEDTRVKSLYNTYTNLGLPPAPINNPGLSAIKAALNPKETDYYFFLSASDGTTIFSKTLEEHNTNKAKYLE
ncbi:endolytic transglycosylase MltG [Patescibacteria group bacterium]|nr:endolytic transglycosylase MltG [Patescibacteria group bacterium]MBU4458577.1 endolytic transglycosylase MltG [Patescibacteria group bacterium]MCG2696105.1 endolytic transglycosylase MltG [Candidatus Portnoybacteria bacterium]